MNVDRPAESFIVLPGMRKLTTDPNHPAERRLAGLGWLPNRVRNLFIAMMGEFVGTFLFLFFAFSATQVANAAAAGRGTTVPKAPNTSVLLYISLAFGFSLAVNAWVFFRISGGLFNPAVTLGMCLVGAVGWPKGAVVALAQILGAISAAGIVSALFPGPLAVRTTLSSETSVVRGLFIEMFLTAQLIFTIFMLAAEKHKGTFLAPVGIGLSLFIAELSGVYFTGGSMNPARSFGPDVVLGTFNGYHWIYWVGPFLGSLVAILFYRIVKVLEYETANPGQDFDDKEAATSRRSQEVARTEDVRRPDAGTGYNRRMDSAEEVVENGSRHNAKHSNSNRYDHDKTVGKDIGYSIRHSNPNRPSTHQSRSRGHTGSGERTDDLYPEPASAVYQSEDPHAHFRHDRSYYNGPHAESGSAGYSDWF
ncbi:aquaporin-like protein [Cenococcum geophilum]